MKLQINNQLTNTTQEINNWLDWLEASESNINGHDLEYINPSPHYSSVLELDMVDMWLYDEFLQFYDEVPLHESIKQLFNEGEKDQLWTWHKT